MKAKFHLRFGFALACLCLSLSATRATTFLTFQSTYLGDGWFQYQMNVMKDPFFASAAVTEVGLHFTNQIDQVTGTNGLSYQGVYGWEFTNGYPAIPYSETFLARSSETSYRMGLQTNFDGATVIVSLVLNGIYPGMSEGVFSQNIVGYAMMPCLIPCSPAEADGSPTNAFFTLKLLPDVNINQLLQTNGNVYGVDFTWESASTFLLQGSTDFNAWTNIAYLWSYPPETVWTTNTPLNGYGQFFRVELVADGYPTNLPPLNNAVSASRTAAKPNIPGATLRVTNCQVTGNKIAVSVATQPGQAIQVQALTSRGTVAQSQQIVPAKNTATVSFNSASLPNPVFFQAVVAP